MSNGRYAHAHHRTWNAMEALQTTESLSKRILNASLHLFPMENSDIPIEARETIIALKTYYLHGIENIRQEFGDHIADSQGARGVPMSPAVCRHFLARLQRLGYRIFVPGEDLA